MSEAQDAYVPPKSDVAMPDTKPGSPIKAVVFGVVVDLVGTIIISIPIGIAWAAMLTIQGMGEKEMLSVMQNPSITSPFMIVSMIFGCLISVLAGYVCGRVAKKLEYRLAAIVGIIVISIVLLLTGTNQALFMNLFLAVITALSIFLGSYIAAQKNSRNSSKI